MLSVSQNLFCLKPTELVRTPAIRTTMRLVMVAGMAKVTGQHALYFVLGCWILCKTCLVIYPDLILKVHSAVQIYIQGDASFMLFMLFTFLQFVFQSIWII